MVDADVWRRPESATSKGFHVSLHAMITIIFYENTVFLLASKFFDKKARYKKHFKNHNYKRYKIKNVIFILNL